jgi:NAD(P)-dependent dehydrogenase (short-subunit alcohol dehydrogenase family)
LQAWEEQLHLLGHSEDSLMRREANGKVALITGGSRGIGASCVRRFILSGWNVATVHKPEESSTPVPQSSVLSFSGDIAAKDVRESVVEQTLARYGRIDVLVNNAGVGLYGPPSSLDLELLRRMLEVNFFAALHLAQLVIPCMRRQRSGAIVNIGSVGGEVALPWSAGYCASKYALHTVTDSLRRELRRDGIRVVKICPGIVSTDFRKNVLSGVAPPLVLNLRRMVTPDAVAEAVFRGVRSHSSRTIYIPRIGRLFTATQHFFPWLMDWYLGGLSAPEQAAPDPIAVSGRVGSGDAA